MIEKIVRDYLVAQNIEGIGSNIKMQVPENPPTNYLVIQKTGSGRTDRIDRAMIAIQSISRTSLLTAATTNEAVKEAMLEMADYVDEVYRCELNSDYNFTDTDTKEYRYQAVFNLFF